MRRSGSLAVLLGLGLMSLFTSTAWAQAQATLDRFAAPGPNQVDQIPVAGFTLFVPRPRTGSEPILTWANGTGASPQAYLGLLTNYASHGIFVVASNSTQTGNGMEVVRGIDLAEGMTRTELVCTAGHSQGGSGSINAARDLRVDCAMPIEPDNIFTARANGRDLGGKLSLILCGTADQLAPCGPSTAVSNGSGLFNQSAGPIIQIFGQDATHFTPVGAGQNAFTGVSTAFLAASLLNDAGARALFLGPGPQILQVASFVMNRFKGTENPNLVVRTDPNAFREACSADPQCTAAIQAALFVLACSASPECVAAIQRDLFIQACSADAQCTAAIVAALLGGG